MTADPYLAAGAALGGPAGALVGLGRGRRIDPLVTRIEPRFGAYQPGRVSEGALAGRVFRCPWRLLGRLVFVWLVFIRLGCVRLTFLAGDRFLVSPLGVLPGAVGIVAGGGIPVTVRILVRGPRVIVIRIRLGIARPVSRSVLARCARLLGVRAGVGIGTGAGIVLIGIVLGGILAGLATVRGGVGVGGVGGGIAPPGVVTVLVGTVSVLIGAVSVLAGLGRVVVGVSGVGRFDGCFGLRKVYRLRRVSRWVGRVRGRRVVGLRGRALGGGHLPNDRVAVYVQPDRADHDRNDHHRSRDPRHGSLLTRSVRPRPTGT